MSYQKGVRPLPLQKRRNVWAAFGCNEVSGCGEVLQFHDEWGGGNGEVPRLYVLQVRWFFVASMFFDRAHGIALL